MRPPKATSSAQDRDVVLVIGRIVQIKLFEFDDTRGRKGNPATSPVQRRTHPLTQVHRLALLRPLPPAPHSRRIARPRRQPSPSSTRRWNREAAQSQRTKHALPIHLAGDSWHTDRAGSCNGNLHHHCVNNLSGALDRCVPLHSPVPAADAGAGHRFPVSLFRQSPALPDYGNTKILYQ